MYDLYEILFFSQHFDMVKLKNTGSENFMVRQLAGCSKSLQVLPWILLTISLVISSRTFVMIQAGNHQKRRNEKKKITEELKQSIPGPRNGCRGTELQKWKSEAVGNVDRPVSSHSAFLSTCYLILTTFPQGSL